MKAEVPYRSLFTITSILGLLSFLTLVVLFAQLPLKSRLHNEIKSIRTHARFYSGNDVIEVSLYKKGQDLMKLSSGNKNRSYELSVVFKNDALLRRESLNGETLEPENTSDDGITDLFDMIALNPEYPFQPKEIKFTNELSGETVQVIVDTVEYNSGLPDFLFEIRAPESAPGES